MSNVQSKVIDTLVLTIDPNYVDWNLWECLREFIQNAKDAEDQGYGMNVSFAPDCERNPGVNPCGVVSIETMGTVLSRKALILGNTAKREDDTQRGQFGEGFKVAMARLLDLGHDVVITSGLERWCPKIGESAAFDGAKVLFVEVEPLLERFNGIRICVHGVWMSDYNDMCQKFLFMQESARQVKTSQGSILMNPDYANKIFVRGIFVMESDYGMHFGYDFDHLSLDRDRRIAIDSNDLLYGIAEILRCAVLEGQLTIDGFMALMSGDAGEKTFYTHCYINVSDRFYQEYVREWWVRTYGEAIPVRLEISDDAGVSTICPPSAIFNLTYKLFPTYEEKMLSVASSVLRKFDRDELAPKTIMLLDYMFGTLSEVLFEPFDWHVDVLVVDFRGGALRCVYDTARGKLLLSRNVFDELSLCIRAIVPALVARLVTRLSPLDAIVPVHVMEGNLYAAWLGSLLSKQMDSMSDR